MEKIPKGIVITSSEYTKDFLPSLLFSIAKTNYRVVINYNTEKENGWEISGIQLGKDTFDEFIHIMDTTLIKDISLFDKLFEINGNVFLTKGGYHYMGKFVSCEIPELPIVKTKNEAIDRELRWFKGMSYIEFMPDLPVHTDIFEEIHGQKRMKLENDYMIKWKGTYSI